MNYKPYLCLSHKFKNELSLHLDFIPVYLLGATFIFQLYYLLFVYLKLNRYKVPRLKEDAVMTPLSVIICARNEEENLRTFLPMILEQDYPDFEVIVVNDCSSDDSEWLLKDFSETYNHLHVVHIKEHLLYKHGKKFAVTLGIKAAKHERLVFTDADCLPQSNQWLKYMNQAYQEGAEIVLGYSPYIKTKGLLNALIRFETFHTAMSYLSYALKRNAYMGVGRNMAYLKSLFFKGKGFAAHMHIPSGDDDLFVNQNATRHNTRICIHPDAQVWSKAKTTYSSYYNQKIRHHGASKAYKPRHRLMLATQVASVLLFYVAWVLSLLFLPQYWELIVGVYLVRLLIQTLVYERIMKTLRVPDLLIFLPFLDIIYYFYIGVNGFRAFLKKNISWK